MLATVDAFIVKWSKSKVSEDQSITACLRFRFQFLKLCQSKCPSKPPQCESDSCPKTYGKTVKHPFYIFPNQFIHHDFTFDFHPDISIQQDRLTFRRLWQHRPLELTLRRGGKEEVERLASTQIQQTWRKRQDHNRTPVEIFGKMGGLVGQKWGSDLSLFFLELVVLI